jgi:sugar phosphate isomerase/epimerase
MKPMTRRKFIATAATAATGLNLQPFPLHAFNIPVPEQKNAVSLATWSLNRTYAAGYWELLDIPRICREDFGIEGIEYVTHFFTDVRDNYLRPLKKAVNEYGVQSVLIMVDREGDMVSPDKQERMQAAINHRKWVEIAAYLECKAIRCNATVAHGREGGDVTPEQDPDSLDRAVESFSALLEYAREFNMRILIEPHGGRLSTNPRWLVTLAEKLNDPLFGLLPDFNNFDVETADEIYQAVQMTMPYAKGVSVKGGWDPDGTHPGYSIEKCLEIARDSGYEGFWGIESRIRRPRNYYDRKSVEEIKADEWQAVRWTKAVIDKVVLNH